MQHCSALPFIVESIIITVSRWGLGDVYYEFFIFSIITEKKQNKKMLVHFVFIEGVFRGGYFSHSLQAGAHQLVPFSLFCFILLIPDSPLLCQGGS